MYLTNNKKSSKLYYFKLYFSKCTQLTLCFASKLCKFVLYKLKTILPPGWNPTVGLEGWIGGEEVQVGKDNVASVCLIMFPQLKSVFKWRFWRNRFKSRTWVSSSEHSDAQVTSLYRIPSQVIESQPRNMVDLSSRHGFNPKYLAKLQGRKRPNSMKLFNYMKMGPEMFLYLY